MAVLRCKVCGGKVTFAKDSKVAVCEFCGAEQTFDELEDVVPKKPKTSKGTKKNGAIKRVRNDPRLRRGFELLSEGEFDKAYRFFEHVLDDDIGNAGAYLGKLMALYEFWTIEELETSGLRLKEDENFKKALLFAEPAFAVWLEEMNAENTRIFEKADRADRFMNAWSNMNKADKIFEAAKKDALDAKYAELFARCEGLFREGETLYREAEEEFRSIAEKDSKVGGNLPDDDDDEGYEIVSITEAEDPAELADKCLTRMEECGKLAEEYGKEEKYLFAREQMQASQKRGYQDAANALSEISGYKDADSLLCICQEKLDGMTAEEEKQKRRLYEERQKEEQRLAEERAAAIRKRAKLQKIAGISLGSVLLLVVVLVLVYLCM